MPDQGRKVVWQWFSQVVDLNLAKKPATLYVRGRFPDIFVSFQEDNPDLSRELFNPEMDLEVSEGVRRFYWKHIPDLNVSEGNEADPI
jgi:hypothetical protein